MTGAMRIERGGPGAVRVVGPLGFAQAGAAFARAGELFHGAGGQVEVDVSGIEEADSATLATLLGWSAAAARNGVRLRYLGVVPALDALARLCDAGALLHGDVVVAPRNQ